VGLNSIANFERMNLTTGGGNDTITGYGFDDIIVTGAGDDIVDAGMHNAGGGGLDFVDGGAGNDLLIVDASGEVLGVQLFSGGAPSFSVRSTTDRLSVDAYNMESVKFTGGAGNDLANGGGGKDILAGGLGSDTLNGGGAGDTISGNAGSDTIDGGDGLDTIDAGKDADTLHGGAGADQLTGGGQADVFLYDLKSDSTIANSDTITDFQVGLDDIDLSDLDADSTSGGLQHFTFIASAAFSGVAGELRAVAGTVEADINGDGTADFRILIGNGATLGAGDFILS